MATGNFGPGVKYPAQIEIIGLMDYLASAEETCYVRSYGTHGVFVDISGATPALNRRVFVPYHRIKLIVEWERDHGDGEGRQ